MSRYRFAFPFVFGVFTLTSQLHSAPATWVGATSDLLTSSNWNPFLSDFGLRMFV